jgi:hypothetical protein
MYPNIKDRIVYLIQKKINNDDFENAIDIFNSMDFTDEELDKINEIPPGVNDIDYNNSNNFAQSFKKYIDNNEFKEVNIIMENLVRNIEEKYDGFPINPNKNKFKTAYGLNIIEARIKQVLEDRHMH